MTSTRVLAIEQQINLVLRFYGTLQRHGLDQESLERFREGRFTVYKLTSDRDQRSVFGIAQDHRDMFLSGDVFNQKYIAGEWEMWLYAKAQAASSLMGNRP
jgi:CRP-like cAMP-binding protein